MPTSGSLELRLLGAPSIQAQPGFEAAAVLAQPKRFALLAYLAAATPYGFHRRDTLLALFWPEADQEHGRTALRKAIHVLRRELGHDVILSRGEADLGLADDAWCDVRAFEDALSSGRPTDALAYYRGDLLPGLYLADSPDFERWLEETRERLRGRAAEAAWDLVDRLERGREPDEAAHWARWARALVPDDERALRRLLALLARLGDRAGAMHVYEEFAGRMRREYQAAPAPETTRLLETISTGGDMAKRERHAAPGTARAASSSSARATLPESTRQDIAIFPFRVRGDESAAYLQEGLVDLLSTNLDHAGSLHVIDPHALINLAARDGGGPLDPERAAALARHFGAHHYVLGSVVSAAGQLRLSASLYHTGGSTESARHMAAAGPAEQLFDLVDELTAKLVGELHPGPAHRLVRLATTTTGSLPALKSYLAGEKALRAGRYVDAVEAFQRAVDQDPEFALAWYRLAFILSWPTLPQPNMSPDLANRALHYQERLSPRDSALLEALYASLTGDPDEAERRYQELVAIHPEDVDGWLAWGQMLMFHNEGRGRLITEARAPFERALALDPANATVLLFLCYLAQMERNYEESKALLARVPAESDFVYPRLVHAIGMGDPASREEAFRFLSSAPDAAVYEQTRFVATLTRDFGAARRIADYLGDPARPAIVRGHAPILAAFLELTSGRWAATRRALRTATPILPAVAMEYQGLFATLSFLPYDDAEVDRVRSLLAGWDAAAVPPGSHPYPAFDLHRDIHAVLRLFFLGALSARLGDPSALDSAGELESLPGGPDAEALARDLAHGVRARYLWRGGDAVAALAALDRARCRPRQIMVVLQSPFYSRTAERWLRAELLRQVGRLAEAARWYETLSQASLYDLIYLAPSQLRLGQIYQELGDLPRAAGHYRQFTELWADCDPELRPLVADASHRLARLPRPARSSPPPSRARVG